MVGVSKKKKKNLFILFILLVSFKKYVYFITIYEDDIYGAVNLHPPENTKV